jgi:1,4-alpha-glucan branching enzyme
VVHGKGSLARVGCRATTGSGSPTSACLLAYQWLFPGKKLLFMGGEFGQNREWNHNTELDWWLLNEGPYHAGTLRLVADLNALSFLRFRGDGTDPMLVILNLTPVLRSGYRVGVPLDGRWIEVLNTDSATYGGGNQGNLGGIESESIACHGQPYSAEFTLPPMAVVVFEFPVETPDD